MATIPVYTTFTAGAILTAAQLNTQIVASGGFLINRPLCSVSNAAGIASAASGTSTLIPFDVENEDTDNMHSTVTNPSRVIFQTLGLWALNPFSGWPSNATGSRVVDLRLNAAGSSAGGTKIAGGSAQGHLLSDNIQVSYTWRYRAQNIGDYTEMFITQNSGGALAVTGSGVNGLFALWQAV